MTGYWAESCTHIDPPEGCTHIDEVRHPTWRGPPCRRICAQLAKVALFRWARRSSKIDGDEHGLSAAQRRQRHGGARQRVHGGWHPFELWVCSLFRLFRSSLFEAKGRTRKRYRNDCLERGLRSVAALVPATMHCNIPATPPLSLE
eukprot:scaffold11328_cov73-Phaeocystis_antarctica.AAC.2